MSGKASKARKHTRAQLELLAKPQLISLAVQRVPIPYQIACEQTKNYLIEALVDVEDVLVPVVA